MSDAESFGAVFAKKERELPGIEVICVVGDRREFRRRKLLGRPASIAQMRLKGDHVREGCPYVSLQPAGNQIGFGIPVGQRERMKVVILLTAADPALELRALLE
jgi:hypothetical protein